jgi:hypothetical protein
VIFASMSVLKIKMVRPTALLFIGVILAACSREGPPLVRDLKCDTSRYGDCLKVSLAFNDTIRNRYPTGSDAAAMISDLHGMGFSYSGPGGFTRCMPQPGDMVAHVESGVPCPTWDVHWNPQHQLAFRFHPFSIIDCSKAVVMWTAGRNGKLTGIEGRYITGGCAWP